MTLAQVLDAALDAYPGRAQLCGVIRISRGGEVLLERAYGQASVQLGIANRTDTRFHIASATKMFISAAVVRLVTDGRISLQDRPADHHPDLSGLDERITVHHLLSHRSGLPDIYDQPHLSADMAQLADRKGRLIDHLTALPLAFEPGTRWAYSSTGYLLLAYLVEAVSGMAFGEAVREMFLAPLGLHDTGPDDPFRVNPGRASGHVRRAEGWFNAPNDALAGIDGPSEFYSTAADLDRWATGVLEGRVLSKAGLETTFTPYSEIGGWAGLDPSYRYGYGWFLGADHRWIGGMTGGFRSSLWQFPAERLNVVMLWNTESVNSRRLFAALRPILLP